MEFTKIQPKKVHPQIATADMLTGAQLDVEEKALLDREYADYIANPGAGTDWKEVAPRLRQQLRK